MDGTTKPLAQYNVMLTGANQAGTIQMTVFKPLLTLLAANEEGFLATYGPGQGFVAPNGTAVAYAPEGGAAVAVAPPKVEHKTLETVREVQKAKRRSKRCWCIVLLVLLIVVIVAAVAIGIGVYESNKSDDED